MANILSWNLLAIDDFIPSMNPLIAHVEVNDPHSNNMCSFTQLPVERAVGMSNCFTLKLHSYTPVSWNCSQMDFDGTLG